MTGRFSGRPAVSETLWTRVAPYVVVGAGAAIGGGLRWLISVFSGAWYAPLFPWDTLFVNATGSFLIGAYFCATLDKSWGQRMSTGWRQLFLMTGLLGGYTTFSIFSLETLQLLQTGRVDLAVTNIGLSVLVWLAAVWCGFALVQRLSRRHDRGVRAD